MGLQAFDTLKSYSGRARMTALPVCSTTSKAGELVNNRRTLKKDGLLYDLKKNRVKWLMLVPSIIFFVLMCYIPMAGIVLAFKQYTYNGGIFGSPWVGFDNFQYFIQSGKLWTITRNTIAYNAVFLIVNNVLQITCAIILSELAGKFFKRFTQSVMFLPYFISWVVVGAFIYNLFNYEFGSVNTLLKAFNMEPIDVYSNETAWMLILVAVSAFKTLGYGTVLYLASIIGIDSEQFEAADIDGATKMQKIWHITLPGIRPTIIILFLLSIGTIMKGDFQMFYQVIGDNPMVLDATDVIDTYVVRSMLQLQEYGMTAAAGFYQSVFSFALILFANYVVRRVEKDYSLF